MPDHYSNIRLVAGARARQSTAAVDPTELVRKSELDAAAGGGGGAFTYSSTAPSSPEPGDRWVDSDIGICFTWVDDGTSAQWVEL